MDILIKELKTLCIGFPCIHKIENHFSECSHRIFLLTSSGTVTLFWFENTNKIVCKSRKFLDIIKKHDIIGKML